MKKRARIILFFLFSLIILFTECKKSNSKDAFLQEDKIVAKEIKKSKGVGVVNVNRLRFRADKDLHAKTLRYFDKGTIVTIVEKDYKRIRIGEVEDYWYKIEFEGIVGWVFGYYLDIYQSYESAKIASKKHLEFESTDNSLQDVYYEDAINKNLFFLSNSKIYQVIDGRRANFKQLRTQAGAAVIKYFFSTNPSNIYYVAKNFGNLDENGNLYLYNLETERYRLLIKDVYDADINISNNIALILSIQTSLTDTYWQIQTANINHPSDLKNITKIKISRNNENAKDDIFTNTLERELGSFVRLNLDEKNNIIYFKPPEENRTYLISISDGKFIQIDIEESNFYDIDSSQYVSVLFEEKADAAKAYTIILKDKFSGIEKEIVTSNLYPINFSTSPKKNFLAISMIDVNAFSSNYYPSSVYVLSLSTYSLMPINMEPGSYQPRWSSTLLR